MTDYYPGCQCARPLDDCEDHLRWWLSAPRISVGPYVRALLFTRAECAAPDDFVGGAPDLELRIRRRGQADATLKYRAFDTDVQGRVRFIVDAQIFMLPKGRYEGTIYQGTGSNAVRCSSFELVRDKPCVVDVASVATSDGEEFRILNGELPGMTHIFDAVDTFHADICAVLEPTSRTIPLKEADVEILCGAVLCRPVQLVLTDGVKSEIVEFSACDTSGDEPVVTVTRGVGGTAPARFPNGSTLAYHHTADNIAALVQGCV